MPRRHLGLRNFAALSRSRLTRRLNRRYRSHLERCLTCQTRLAQHGPRLTWQNPLAQRDSGKARTSAGAAAYHYVFGQAFEAAAASADGLCRGRAEAPELLASLLRHPRGQWPQLVDRQSRYHSWPLVELLLVEGHRLCKEQPEEAEGLVSIALTLLGHLQACSEWTETAPLAGDLGARAWACRGRALEWRGDLEAAAEAFRAAEALLESGSGDPLERAEICRLKASLLERQGRPTEAVFNLRLALWTFGRAGEDERVVKVAEEIASLLSATGKAGQAVHLLRKVQRWLGPNGPAQLRLALSHLLVAALVKASRPQEARDLLPSVRRLTHQVGERVDRLRLLWAEGRIALALGALPQAEQCLRVALEGLRQLEAEAGTRQVAIDLISMYLRQGRHAEARQLGAELEVPGQAPPTALQEVLLTATALLRSEDSG